MTRKSSLYDLTFLTSHTVIWQVLYYRKY